MAGGASGCRVASLLPCATDTLRTLGFPLAALALRTHECEWPDAAPLVPVCTSNKLGDGLNHADIDAAMTSCSSASAATAAWRPRDALTLLHTGLSCYALDLGKLLAAKPTVVLTQLQGAGAAAATAAAYRDALERLTGVRPVIVHLAANSLAEVWQDMQAVADAVGLGAKGRELVADAKRRLAAAADACRGRRRWDAACLQWLEPAFVAGSWVPELLELANARDVLGRRDGSATQVTPQQVAGAARQA